MTERSLYALPDRALTLLVAAVLSVPAAAYAQSSDRVPCAACIVLSITPGQSVLIGPPLEGLEVLVRVDAAAPSDVRHAVDAVRRAGGRPGLWLPGPAVTVDAALASVVHRIV